MCNAYSLTLPRRALIDMAVELATQFDLELDFSATDENWTERYRISPRQWCPIVNIAEDGRLRLSMALWGFLTSGGKPGFAPTNARSDKLEGGWPWKLVSRNQRCLVPADGFFEPEKPAGDKGVVPWSYYAMGNRQPFWMAGLFNSGPHPKTGETVASFTVITTDANDAIRIHNRMPVIVDVEQSGVWLRPGAVPMPLTEPYPAHRMKGWRVPDEARNSRIRDHEGMILPPAQNSLFE